MIFKETRSQNDVNGDKAIATAFFQHLPKISAFRKVFPAVLRASEFKFVEANIGIRLHLSLLVQLS